MAVTAQAYDVAPGEVFYARTTVTSAERVEIPANMQDKFCRFAAETSAVYIRFGDDSVSVDSTARSGLSTETLTEDGDEPQLFIPAGQYRDFRIDDDVYTHFSHISADTSGVLRFGSFTGVGE
jgi:hypothetical protein